MVTLHEKLILDDLLELFSPDRRLCSEEKNNLEQIIHFENNLLLISPYRNHALYSQILAFTESSDLTIILLPLSSSINKEVSYLKTLDLGPQVAALTSDLYPNQARKLISEIASGAYKILFLTPESFLYWFSSGFNSMAIEHYRKLSENDLGKQVFMSTQAILKRVTRIIFREFELVAKENAIHKPKYLEAINLIRELEIPILGLSFVHSPEILQSFSRYFPNTPVISESLRLNNISLNAKYCFSRLEKQKYLVKLLKEEKPTLVCVAPDENLADLVNYIRKQLPDLSVKAFHPRLPTEQKAEALDYFLTDKSPVFITALSSIEGIVRTDILRLIHYSPSNSLVDYYKEIHILEKSSEAHLLLCEDDLRKIASYEVKDGLIVKREKQISQLLHWIAKKENCRWHNLEEVLLSFTGQSPTKCGVCDLCKNESIPLLTTAALFFLKKKFK